MSFFAGSKSIIHTFQGTTVAYPTYAKIGGTQLPLKGPIESFFFFSEGSQSTYQQTVDGRNPAPVDMVLSCSHY